MPLRTEQVDFLVHELMEGMHAAKKKFVVCLIRKWISRLTTQAEKCHANRQNGFVLRIYSDTYSSFQVL